MFIFLKTDAFQNVAQRSKETDEILESNSQTSVPIRRPYRGIQIKGDTYSTISIRSPNGKIIPLTSSSDTNGKSDKPGRVVEYADYILQSVQDERQEKQQIIETFGDPFVYFFGERPRILTISGLLINTEDFNWRSQFWENYNQHLRGTQLVQQNARAYLSFDTIVVEGYPLQASATDDINQPYSIPFQLSMLVTAYYDWSNIGSTRFPGFGQGVQLDVLNKELEDRRSKFVSTGAAVRKANLEASLGAGGILATLRGGIRTINSAVSTVRGITNAIGRVVGGRNVRVPLGVAGFLQSTGSVQIAAGSILSGAASAQSQFDAATGQFTGFRGALKIRVPATSLYAPSWVSQAAKGQARGYIYENVDEYPTRQQPLSLNSLLKPSDSADLQERLRGRQGAISEDNVAPAAQELIEQSGGLVGDLAEAVSFAKSSFSMVLTGAAFIQDPAAKVAATFGVSLGGVSAARLAARSEQLAVLGIKVKANEGILSQYLGFKAGNTFNNLLTGKKEELDAGALPSDVAVEIGEVYQGSQYLTQGSDLDFESVYGNKDYAALLAAAALQGQEAGFTEENVQASLDEVYGNNDAAPAGTEVDPASFDEVYGTGSSSSSIRSPEEIAAILQAVQQAQIPNDEDTTGIRGVEDDGAQIDPIV